MPMLHRQLTAAAVLCAAMGAARSAQASGGWLASASFAPVEQRVAVAAGLNRTTLWTSLRFQAAGGAAAIVVPAPPSASIVLTSDAWFEALEVATAPRIFPPANVDPLCPGTSGPKDIFQLVGDTGHTASPAVQSIAVLDDAAAVSTWATQANLSVSAGFLQSIEKLTGVRFVALLFDTKAGSGVTPTVRVVTPTEKPLLPLTLTRAADHDLQVTAWYIGAGRADLMGAVEVAVSTSSVTWDANEGTSNYDDLRSDALASDPTRFLVEAAGHTMLAKTQTIGNGIATIDSVVSTFFERAASYGDGSYNAAACISKADLAIESTTPLALSCPQASLVEIDPVVSCVEAPSPNETNPADLRCGPGADDLAVALSGLTPSQVWVTRQSLVIPSSTEGPIYPVDFAAGSQTSSVIYAAHVDLKDCHADGGSSSSSSSSSGSHRGSSSSSGGHGKPIIHDYGTDPGGGLYVDIDVGYVIDDADTNGCACSGRGVDLSSDSCSSDTSGSYESCSSSSEDDASCSSSEGDSSCDSSEGDSSCDSSEGDSSCSSSEGDSSCSGGSSDEACSSGGSGESCSSGGGGESCSSSGGEMCSGSSGSGCSGSSGSGCSGGGSSGCSGSSFDCSTTGKRRPRGPKFSIVLLSALAVLVPLRRLGRRSRSRKRA